jgi:hypothetical protein
MLTRSAARAYNSAKATRSVYHVGGAPDAVRRGQTAAGLGKEDDMSEKDDHGHGDRKVDVVVITTSGVYPHEGADAVPANQKVRVQLRKAAEELNLADTDGWVARVGDKEIDPDKSYADNGFTGAIRIDWGPREGGGGGE